MSNILVPTKEHTKNIANVIIAAMRVTTGKKYNNNDLTIAVPSDKIAILGIFVFIFLKIIPDIINAPKTAIKVSRMPIANTIMLIRIEVE